MIGSRVTGMSLETFAVDHGVSAVGYALVEDDRPGRFEVETADALGVPNGPQRGALQHGEDVTLADGRVVRSGEVLGSPRAGRRIVISGDTAPTDTVVGAATGATLLVHEATFLEDERERARDTSHSTAVDAATIAREAGVGVLALTHLSNRYSGRDAAREAREVFADTVVPRDFDTIELPFPERGEPRLVKGGAIHRGEVATSLRSQPRARPSAWRRTDHSRCARHQGGSAAAPATGRTAPAARLGLGRGLVMEIDFARDARMWLGLYEIELATVSCRALRRGWNVLRHRRRESATTRSPSPGSARGRVLAVEADAGVYARLERSIAANPTLSPLIVVRQASVARVTDGARGRSVSIDDLAYGHGGFVPDLVKLDVEGSEVAALRGRAEAPRRAQAAHHHRDALGGSRRRVPVAARRPRLLGHDSRASALAPRGALARVQPLAASPAADPPRP